MTDPDLVRQLANVLNAANLTRIEVADGPHRISVARAAGATPTAGTVPAVSALPVPARFAPAPEPQLVRSPAVGLARLAAPASPGRQVKDGDTLMTVEVLGVAHAVFAPASGAVDALLVEDGQPVEFGQPLVAVRRVA